MKNFGEWLNPNKISIDVQNKESLIFKLQRKKIDGDTKIKINRKKLQISQSGKYFGIKIDKNLK